MPLNRRDILAGLGAIGLASGLPLYAFPQTNARIVVIGGGFGGTSAARTLKRLLPNASIALIEPKATYVTCPFSNVEIGKLGSLTPISFSYTALEAEGIKVHQAEATSVDPIRQTVQITGGENLAYDRLILSPGIDFRANAIDGYDLQDAPNRMPHAWKAGDQTRLLMRQLREMEDGGLFVMSVPPAPYRCPPGPYERASLIAHYFKTQKPRSKVLILDGKDQFSKMPLFQEAWKEHYPDHLEWRSATDDGRVSKVDIQNLTLSTDFEDIQADVANVIPPQKAGTIAERAGVTDSTGWCPIDALSFASTLQPNIHVIGDATIAAPMPKSAFSANLQGKICAHAIARILAGKEPIATTLANTCYSFTTPDEAVSIVGVYSNSDSTLSSIPGAGGLSPLAADKSIRYAEARQAKIWYDAITTEAFG
jgi:sulfide dehydrogenase [flavocytochrome c] flavoprotein subunit